MKQSSVKATRVAALSAPGHGVSDSLAAESFPTTDEIAHLAYSYWEARVRACSDGCAEDDWARTEQELLRQQEVAAKGA